MQSSKLIWLSAAVFLFIIPGSDSESNASENAFIEICKGSDGSGCQKKSKSVIIDTSNPSPSGLSSFPSGFDSDIFNFETMASTIIKGVGGLIVGSFKIVADLFTDPGHLFKELFDPDPSPDKYVNKENYETLQKHVAASQKVYDAYESSYIEQQNAKSEAQQKTLEAWEQFQKSTQSTFDYLERDHTLRSKFLAKLAAAPEWIVEKSNAKIKEIGHQINDWYPEGLTIHPPSNLSDSPILSLDQYQEAQFETPPDHPGYRTLVSGHRLLRYAKSQAAKSTSHTAEKQALLEMAEAFLSAADHHFANFEPWMAHPLARMYARILHQVVDFVNPIKMMDDFICDAIILATGVDPRTNEEVTATERALSAANVILTIGGPYIGKGLGATGKYIARMTGLKGKAGAYFKRIKALLKQSDDELRVLAKHLDCL